MSLATSSSSAGAPCSRFLSVSTLTFTFVFLRFLCYVAAGCGLASTFARLSRNASNGDPISVRPRAPRDARRSKLWLYDTLRPLTLISAFQRPRRRPKRLRQPHPRPRSRSRVSLAPGKRAKSCYARASAGRVVGRVALRLSLGLRLDRGLRSSRCAIRRRGRAQRVRLRAPHRTRTPSRSSALEAIREPTPSKRWRSLGRSSRASW